MELGLGNLLQTNRVGSMLTVDSPGPGRHLDVGLWREQLDEAMRAGL